MTPKRSRFAKSLPNEHAVRQGIWLRLTAPFHHR